MFLSNCSNCQATQSVLDLYPMASALVFDKLPQWLSVIHAKLAILLPALVSHQKRAETAPNSCQATSTHSYVRSFTLPFWEGRCALCHMHEMR